MAVIESTARITRKYLMNKDKNGICDVVFLVLDESDRLRAELERVKGKLKEARAKPKPAPKPKPKPKGGARART